MPKRRVVSMLWSSPVFILPDVNFLNFLLVINFKNLSMCQILHRKNVVLVYKLTCHQEVKPTTTTGCYKHRQGAQQHRYTALPKAVTEKHCCVHGNSFELVTRESSVSSRSSTLPSGLRLALWHALDDRKWRDGWYMRPKPSPKMHFRRVFLCGLESGLVGTGSCAPMVLATGQLTPRCTQR